ncbi:hypothetical protein VHE8714_03402 [Vibrio splendidus]|nr:hypothetical protein VHE8714_03402 [Vibrio splendidus]
MITFNAWHVVILGFVAQTLARRYVPDSLEQAGVMNNLFTYISAMKNEPDGLSIVEKVINKQTSEEDGILMENSDLFVKFNNGVAIKKLTERELSGHVTGAVCEECWISYEVTEQPSALNIAPKKKNFTNQCQESFWLKINKVQSST